MKLLLSGTRASLGAAVVLVVLICFAFWPGVHGGFIWDDDAHLTANPHIVGPLGFAGIWTTSDAVYYPLVLTSFWAQHRLWGLNPLPYHVVNILMHAACALLLWRVLKALNVRAAWFGAALWAVHPMQVESVAWITELKNTQSCLFYLLAIRLFLNWLNVKDPTDGRHWRWSYSLALLSALLAILSKSSTVMLPVVLALCWWWRDGRWRWRNTPWLAPFFGISCAAGIWTIWEQKHHSLAAGAAWMQTWPERFVTAGKIVWFYFGKQFWPHPLVFIYPRWTINATQVLSYLPAIGAGVALVVLWFARNGRLRPVFFAFSYFVVSLFPVSDFFDVYFFRFSFVGDHFQYLAGIGLLALAAAGIVAAAEVTAKGKPFVVPVICGALLLGLSILSAQQSLIYTNSLTLWRDTIRKNPSTSLAHTNLGLELILQSRFMEAIEEYEAALRIDPDDEDAHNNLAAELAEMGRIPEAVQHLRDVLRIEPRHADAHNNLANALAQLNQMPEALEHWRQALQIKPDFLEAHYNFAIALVQQSRFDEAIEHYQRVLQLKPDDDDARQGLALALQNRH